MTIHFHMELNNLRRKMLAEAALVETAIEKAMRALAERSEALARDVMAGDREIDRAEIEVEEDCLKILALHAPVAVDLRFIVSVLKMNNDLERMGDIAVSLSRRAIWFSKRDPIDFPADLGRMGEKVRWMIKRSLDALINSDVRLAREVCGADDEVDALKREIMAGIRDRIEREPANLRPLLKMLDVPRHYERLADLATNLSEDVIYLATGEIVRHQRADEPQDLPAQQGDD